MKEETNKKALDELHKGCCMGVDAIEFVLDKVETKEFKDVLKIEQDKYKKIKKKIENIYPNYSKESPQETSLMNKAMTWYGIEMKTMMKKDSSKLAELLLQGTNMGIIEGRKLLNNKDTDECVEVLIDEYVRMQEGSVETLKKYL